MNTPEVPSREEIDSELTSAIMGYDRTDKYPEWGNDAMREAYRAGFEDGACEAVKPFRELVERIGKFRLSPVSDVGLLLADLRSLVYTAEELS